MYKVLHEKDAYLAYANVLPEIGKEFICTIITSNTSINNLVKATIIPGSIETICGNIIKIDTAFDGVFFVMLPTLTKGNIYFSEIDTIPYIDTILECKLFDSSYLKWVPTQCEKVKKVAKLSDNLFFIKTITSQYFALKE